MLVKSLNQHRPTICSREQHGRVMVRRVWIESWKHGLRFRGDTNPLTIGYNKHVLDNSIKHIRASVPKIILKPVCHVVGSIPRERSTSPNVWRHAAGLLTYRSFCSAFPTYCRSVTFKISNIGLRITAAGLCRILTCFPYTECGAKVQQKMHICKKNEWKFTFKRIFLADMLHWANVASGELLKGALEGNVYFWYMQEKSPWWAIFLGIYIPMDTWR